MAWLVAAACLVISAVSWWPQAAEPSLADQRARLLREATDVVVAEWSPTEDPAAVGASGDVVWSTSAQRGFIRLRGMAVNDPRKEQYQLWIFDAQQDERFPIDGGVFDVDGDLVVVPITAKLPVTQPTMFAVTIEKPGGVVVSTRGRLPLLAKVSSGQAS